MKFSFDLNLTTALTVAANTEQEARQILKDCLECASANLGAFPSGDPILAEVTLNEYPVVYAIDGDEVEKHPVRSTASVQWKGTDVCADYYCLCGEQFHLDGEFIYSVQCPHCNRRFEAMPVIQLRELAEGETVYGHEAVVGDADSLDCDIVQDSGSEDPE